MKKLLTSALILSTVTLALGLPQQNLNLTPGEEVQVSSDHQYPPMRKA